MRTMLLIENDDQAAALITESFCEVFRDHLIVRASSGEAGLEYIAHGLPPGVCSGCRLPDMVYLDISLPWMSGLECLALIRSHPNSRALPVIVLADEGQSAAVARAYELGASSFFTKPRDIRDFIIKLTELNLYWSQTVEIPPAIGSAESVPDKVITGEADYGVIH
jgi:CheY-like chemotaxis protein